MALSVVLVFYNIVRLSVLVKVTSLPFTLTNKPTSINKTESVYCLVYLKRTTTICLRNPAVQLHVNLLRPPTIFNFEKPPRTVKISGMRFFPALTNVQYPRDSLMYF